MQQLQHVAPCGVREQTLWQLTFPLQREKKRCRTGEILQNL